MSDGSPAEAAQRAVMLIDLGRYQDAVNILVPLVAANPGHSALLTELGRAHLGLRDPATAVRFAREAVSAEPNDATALQVLAWAAEQANDIALALTATERLLEVEPGALATLNVASRIATTAWAKELQSVRPNREAMRLYQERADSLADRLLETYPDEVPTHIANGFRLTNIHADSVAGVESFRRALALDPSNAETIRMLADATSNVDTKGSIRLARATLALDPGNKLATDVAVSVAGNAMSMIMLMHSPASIVGGLLALTGVRTLYSIVFLVLLLAAGGFWAILYFGESTLNKAQRRLYRRERPVRWYAWWVAIAGIFFCDLLLLGLDAPPEAIVQAAWAQITIGIILIVVTLVPHLVARGRRASVTQRR